MRTATALAIIGVVLMLLLTACSGADTARLEATVAAQATVLAGLAATPQVASAVTTTTTPTSTPLPTSTATSSPTPTPIAYDRSLAGQVRYIANTGGMGVRVRSSCADASPGSGGWAEGTEVTIEYARSDCSGWLKAQRSGGESSWVRVEYLSGTPPPTPVPASSDPFPGYKPVQTVEQILRLTGNSIEVMGRTQPGVTNKLWVRSGPSMNFPVLQNSCLYQKYQVTWRTLGGENIHTGLVGWNGSYFISDFGVASSGTMLIDNGCNQPFFQALGAPNELHDIVWSYTVYRPVP